MKVLFSRDWKHYRILNHEAPWLWAIKQYWRFNGFDGDEILFKRATLDLLLHSKVGLKRQVWLRFTDHLSWGVGECILQVVEESIGKNLVDAINISLSINDENFSSSKRTIHAVVCIEQVHRAGHWGPGESGPPVYVGERVTILKPPINTGFEGLINEVERIRLATQI